MVCTHITRVRKEVSLPIMLKKCVPVFGFHPEAEKIKLELSIELKDITVRIVHAGGREERYYTAILASQLINKYPGMCVALPDVFKNPHASVLSVEDLLLPGRKYYIIPSTTVQKLKRRHPEKPKESGRGKEVVILDRVEDGASGSSTSKDSYSNSDRGKEEEIRPRKTGRKAKKAFVPPIQTAAFRGFGWEPSLTSVQELSQ